LYGDERGGCQFLLPSAQNAAVDPIAAGYLSGARSGLRRLIENLVFVRLAESSPMTFTWSRNNRTRR
jgi:hypothetical protein